VEVMKIVKGERPDPTAPLGKIKWQYSQDQAGDPPATSRRFIPAHKENRHERGRTKEFAPARETKEAPCYEEVHGGEEIKAGGSGKIED
jgi:hypothetical protein